MVSSRVLLPIAILATALPAAAQPFDPVTQAKGWAHQDRDFSFTFYDPAGRSLVTWDKSFGVMNVLSLAKLDAVPSMWLMDRYNNAWVISGDTLYFITKEGKVDRKEKLPAEVADLAWDAQTGFVLSYKTAAPYVEMRDMKDGGVIWSHGQKPKKGDAPGRALFLVTLKVDEGGDSKVYVTDGSTLNLTVLSGKKGDSVGQSVFLLNKQPMAAMNYEGSDPGPVCPWLGREALYGAVASTTLPPGAVPGLNGLLLAKLDLSMGSVQFMPTGLTPDNRFIGIVDSQAVFIKATGGLAYVAIQ